MAVDLQYGHRIITLNFLGLGEDTYFHCISFWCILMNPCFITRNNTTQKFILLFWIPSDKRLNRHQFTVACVRRSVALGVFGTHLADTLKNFRCSWVIVSTEPTLRLNLLAISRTVMHLSARMQVSTWLICYCRTWCSSTNIVTDTLMTAAKVSAPFKHS